jgi:hypothetical protein
MLDKKDGFHCWEGLRSWVWMVVEDFISFLWAIDWVGILDLAGYLDIWGVMRKVSGHGGGEGGVRSVWIGT